MANLKISELGAAGALDGSELIEAVQGGVNVQTTTQDIADLGGGGGTWGSITGTLSAQTDLQAALDNKVNDTGNETIAGVKTFSSDPIIPDEAYDATNWNGVLEPPTKNAIRDKIESMANSSVISNSLVSTTLTADGSGKSGQIQFHNSTAISSNISYVISNMTEVTAFVQTLLITGTVVISFADEVVMQKADTRWDNTASSKDITLTAPDTGNPYVFSFIKCGSLWLMQASGAHYTS